MFVKQKFRGISGRLKQAHNVILHAEMLRDLDFKAAKKLPAPLFEVARGELTAADELAVI